MITVGGHAYRASLYSRNYRPARALPPPDGRVAGAESPFFSRGRRRRADAASLRIRLMWAAAITSRHNTSVSIRGDEAQTRAGCGRRRWIHLTFGGGRGARARALERRPRDRDTHNAPAPAPTRRDLRRRRECRGCALHGGAAQVQVRAAFRRRARIANGRRAPPTAESRAAYSARARRGGCRLGHPPRSTLLLAARAFPSAASATATIIDFTSGVGDVGGGAHAAAVTHRASCNVGTVRRRTACDDLYIYHVTYHTYHDP
ncbi:hypothetical protein EVAR_78284_1 [Eumeta japonica]|uniref:Uncharacterized protein n=1 Tax=Eumeta variegata TaxID=151549 RepID=A0A4C1T311_EUMVA|nr:hypothetical protein EVAR_78284_1 [Eumeta japonica]